MGVAFYNKKGIMVGDASYSYHKVITPQILREMNVQTHTQIEPQPEAAEGNEGPWFKFVCACLNRHFPILSHGHMYCGQVWY